MSTSIGAATAASTNTRDHSGADSDALSSAITLFGRAAFAFIFIFAAFGHFSSEAIGYAAAKGVPLANLAVPASGVLSLAGGLSILLGYRARLGAWLLVLFLVPVTVTLHKFWGIADPGAARLEQVMFLKNLSILGGALLIARFGAGPLSLDARAGRR
jgi:putative oxidoreductase